MERSSNTAGEDTEVGKCGKNEKGEKDEKGGIDEKIAKSK